MKRASNAGIVNGRLRAGGVTALSALDPAGLSKGPSKDSMTGTQTAGFGANLLPDGLQGCPQLDSSDTINPNGAAQQDG